MLIYGYKGKKCPKSTDYWHCEKNLWALTYYNPGLFNDSKVNTEIWLRQVYNTFSTLCRFNNYLVNSYVVDDKFYDDIDFIKQYLTDNEDVVDSVDRKCREVYSNLNTWYKRLLANTNCLDDIKTRVVKSMQFYERQEIFSVASINLKRNYYDFV
jgi:hypothetical protein